MAVRISWKPIASMTTGMQSNSRGLAGRRRLVVAIPDLAVLFGPPRPLVDRQSTRWWCAPAPAVVTKVALVTVGSVVLGLRVLAAAL